MHDRPTDEPGGCECMECGCIFIGALHHEICGQCLAALESAMQDEQQRAEWQAELRRDAFGEKA